MSRERKMRSGSVKEETEEEEEQQQKMMGEQFEMTVQTTV